MKRLARALLCLALALHVLAPVMAYASGALHGDVAHEHCAAESHAGHAHAHGAPPDTNEHHDDGTGTTPPHCPYCPGFAAAAPLAFVPPHIAAPYVVPQAPTAHEAPADRGRASLRVPQSRAPPA